MTENVLTYQIGSIEVIDRRQEFTGEYDWRQLQDIKYLVVHHVGAADADGNPVETDITAERLADYHVNTLGWPGVGYHFLVHLDGQVEYMGDILTRRFSVGQINPAVLAVVLAGNWNVNRPPASQVNGLWALLANLQFALGWHIPILGHRELKGAATRCPGDTAMGPGGWLAPIKADLMPAII